MAAYLQGGKMEDQKINLSTRMKIVDIALGLRVDRAVSTHLAAVTAYFTISGGPVLLTGLLGTVVDAAAGATNVHWETLPTTGAVAPVCALIDVDALVTGTHLTITGVGSAAMQSNATATGLAMMATKVVLSIGALNAEISNASGSTIWSMWYVPLAVGASVVVA